jgi:purine nucleosidase
MTEPLRLIIDTDAGVDDALALMLALTAPGVEVAAITTVTGNVHVDLVVPNVATVLDLCAADVPFYRGAELPLLAEWEAEDPIVHGTDGMGDWPGRVTSARRPQPEHAVLALLDLVNRAPGQYTLVTLGPLTNIALAVRLDPTFPGKLKNWVCMGGTIEGRGNTRYIAAEWNMFCDPEAAAIAFATLPDCTLVSWEATLYNPIPIEEYDRLAALKTARGRFFHGITHATRDFAAGLRGASGFLIPDPLAMAAALDPALIAEQYRAYVAVELNGRYARGQTVIDHEARFGKAPNASIVTRLHMPGVVAQFDRALKAKR